MHLFWAGVDGFGLDAGYGGRWFRRTPRLSHLCTDYATDGGARSALAQRALAINEGNSVEAAVDLLSIAELFPTSDRAPQALYTVGVGAFANQLYVESADALQRAQSNYPDYRWDAVGYWLAARSCRGTAAPPMPPGKVW